MNAMFNPVEFVHRPESAELSRDAAEAIAEGLDDRRRELATRTDLLPLAARTDLEQFATRLDLERFATKVDLEQFATKLGPKRAIDRQTVQFGVMLGAGLAIAVAAIGVIVALFH